MNKWFKILIAVSLVAVLITAFGCGTSSSSSPRNEGIEILTAPSIAPVPVEDADFAVASKQSGGGDTGYLSEIDRKIIKTGYITLVVDNVGDSITEISALAEEMGGYVVSSNKNDNDRGESGNINIRIPADKYDSTLASLRQLATKVPHETTDSQDVTEDYIDLQARLKNLEATEAQYLVLMSKAEKVEDMIKVQDALADVRTEIEQIEGRIKYLDRTIDMSLIQVNLQESAKVQSESWSPADTIKSAINGLISFGKILIDVIIWLLFFGWWAIIIAIVVIVLVRRRNKKAKLLKKE